MRGSLPARSRLRPGSLSRLACTGAIVVACFAFLASDTRAQGTTLLDSLLRAHAYPLDVTPEGLSGPGADFLREMADRLQFVSIGESHNISEIPLFTRALLRDLRKRAGFRYIAFENGPVIMEMVADAARQGGVEGAFELAGRYPHAMQFWTDEEVELAAEAVALSAADPVVGPGGRGPRAPRAVWGLDQAFGGLHILERLGRIAPSPEARTTTARIVAEVRAIESSRAGWGASERWIGTENAAAAIASLREISDAPAGSDPHRLVETLALSNRIYRMRGGTGTFRSNDLRERTMKRTFMERYREAVAAGDPLPRAIAKFGHWHAGRGTSPGGVYSLGNFLSELATANGLESFHISVALLGDVWTLEDYPEYDPLPRIGLDAGGPEGWTIVDLRPLRAHVATGALPGISDELRELALRFDAELLVGGARRATRARLLGMR